MTPQELVLKAALRASNNVDAYVGWDINKVGSGLESWLHEVSHLLLLTGSIDWGTSIWIDDECARRQSAYGRLWGVDHELRTIAVELLVAKAIGLNLDPTAVVDYALDNGNLKPRWRSTLCIDRVLAAIEVVSSEPGVLEAAAFLAREITRVA